MVISNFHPVVGGAERQALLLSRALVQRGWRVQVLTHVQPGLPREDSVDGVLVHRCVKGCGVFYIYTITYILSWLRHMVRLRRSYDVIHCHQIYYHGLAAVLMRLWWGKQVLIKCVSTGDWSDVGLMVRRRFGRLTLGLLRRHARFICISRSVVRDMETLGCPREQLLMIPNGVDTLYFAPAIGVQREPGHVLFVGRLTALKNIPILLRAFRMVLDKRPGLRLSLAGDGEERPGVERLTAEDPLLREHVRILSQVQDVRPLYQRCSLFVLPSVVEGLSNAMLEAMACGCPVVATAVGGNLDLLDPEGRASEGLPDQDSGFLVTPCGILVRPGDENALAAAILKMLDDYDLRYECGRRALRLIEERYSLQRVIERIEAAYLER
ncbi:MAG: hypothetical protein Kow0059_14510 [Candidatus Sumerlaeia bacterium]